MWLVPATIVTITASSYSVAMQNMFGTMPILATLNTGKPFAGPPDIEHIQRVNRINKTTIEEPYQETIDISAYKALDNMMLNTIIASHRFDTVSMQMITSMQSEATPTETIPDERNDNDDDAERFRRDLGNAFFGFGFELLKEGES